MVAEENPYDKLQLTATIPSSDLLFQQKRAQLQPAGLATQQTFDLQAGKVRTGLCLECPLYEAWRLRVCCRTSARCVRSFCAESLPCISV